MNAAVEDAFDATLTYFASTDYFAERKKSKDKGRISSKG